MTQIIGTLGCVALWVALYVLTRKMESWNDTVKSRQGLRTRNTTPLREGHEDQEGDA